MRERNNGVTLISLTVTIIVLLILASITITAMFGDKGIIEDAEETANRTNTILQQEKEKINSLYNELSKPNNKIDEAVEPESKLPSDGSYSDIKGVNTPDLGTGMTAVKWNGSSWVKTAGGDEDWYDYGKTESTRKWANAITDDGSMWVWIPRYAYRITSGYNSSTTGTIEIEFMKGTTNETSTGRTTFDNVSGEGNWNIHPAFEYDTTVPGIWVAKFEASRSDATAESSGSSTTIKIQP